MSPADPAAVSAGLRASALSYTAEQLKFEPSETGANVFGVLMETGYESAVATLSCFFEGATSLYFSGGGGVIGCGKHDSVKAANKTLISIANKVAPHLALTTEYPLPSVGRVRFYLRTPSGTRAAEAPEADLREKRSALWPLYYAGQLVITRIRELGLV
jgi:hypothetical protein